MREKLFTIGIVLLFAVVLLGSSFLTIASAQSVATSVAFAAPAAVSIQVMPQALPDAMVGVPYSQTLSVVAGEGGLFYWMVDGTLPSGLSLNSPATGSNIQISGVPLVAGQSTFGISVTNYNIAATQTYFFTVDTGTSTSISDVSSTIISSTVAVASSELQSQIDDLDAELQELQGTVSNTGQQGVVLGASIGPVDASSDGLIFSRDLTVGDVGPDVQALQEFLNDQGYTVANSGPGSPGSETDYFGSLTQSALARWQAATGISPANGYFGVDTRGQISALIADPSIISQE